MVRSLPLALLLVLSTTGLGFAQADSPRFGRSADDWCRDTSSADRAQHCEVRESTIGGANPIDVDAGRNGGIRVFGWDRGDVVVRARIAATADSDADARRLTSAVRIETDGGRIRAEGPSTDDGAHWSVSFEIGVPRAAQLTLTTHNGGIAIEEFAGAAQLTATNGGVTLRNVGGDIRGGTTNGGLTVDLTGDHWNGAGLDIRTRNGGVRLSIPESYSAELDVATVNGRVNIDFPVTVQGNFRNNHITTTLGSGGPRIKAETTNGGVTIRRR